MQGLQETDRLYEPELYQTADTHPGGGAGLLAPPSQRQPQYNLGLMYDNGLGVPQDNAAAVSWYRNAADQGNAGAQNNLGVMYGNGQGVLQDYVQAHKWISLSASSATTADVREQETKNRDIVAARMTPQQIAEAQRLAQEWKPK